MCRLVGLKAFSEMTQHISSYADIDSFANDTLRQIEVAKGDKEFLSEDDLKMLNFDVFFYHFKYCKIPLQ